MDNTKVFKVTADWIKIVGKTDKLQNQLARENISGMFYLAKSPWLGGMCERLIKEIKKTLHNTLQRSHLSYEVFEAVLVDV